MKIKTRRTMSGLAATATALAVIALSGGPASAEVKTGWIGGTPPVNNVVYLHTSTIDNAAVPKASTRIYTSFGNTVPQGTMGSKARLFREGALCGATDYLFNPFITNSQNAAVTKDCGPGFYNSNGFVAVKTTTGLQEYVTFPSDPLPYPPSTAASASRSTTSTASGTSQGKTYGSAAKSKSDSALPDLVAAIASNGKVGYIPAAELKSDATANGPRSVTVTSLTGERVGTFTFN